MQYDEALRQKGSLICHSWNESDTPTAVGEISVQPRKSGQVWVKYVDAEDGEEAEFPHQLKVSDYFVLWCYVKKSTADGVSDDADQRADISVDVARSNEDLRQDNDGRCDDDVDGSDLDSDRDPLDDGL